MPYSFEGGIAEKVVLSIIVVLNTPTSMAESSIAERKVRGETLTLTHSTFFVAGLDISFWSG